MIRFGKAKPGHLTTPEEWRKYPIWTSAHGGRHDEEALKPIISTDEVTQEIVDHQLIVPIIALAVEGRDLFATAWYLHRDREIFAISIWHDGRWKAPAQVAVLTTPLFFSSVPRILGIQDVRFRCTNLEDERAERV